MIFGTFTVCIYAFFIVLDYATLYLEKKRQPTFMLLAIVWTFILMHFWETLFSNKPLYSLGGIRQDILLGMLVFREILLARIARSENREAITKNIRRNAIALALRFNPSEAKPSP